MKQIFLILIILIGFSNVANAKLLKMPDGNWISENVLHELEPWKNDSCKVYYSAVTSRNYYIYPTTCEEFIKRMDIETKE
jgi:hypothetical protein